jgi:hypothetical protein
MKGRINEVREVNAKAREVVETLGQLADGSALTTVRQAMFETWSTENERAIKQAIFTAWKVNYQQLGDGGEEGAGETETACAGKLDPGEKSKIMNVSDLCGGGGVRGCCLLLWFWGFWREEARQEMHVIGFPFSGHLDAFFFCHVHSHVHSRVHSHTHT